MPTVQRKCKFCGTGFAAKQADVDRGWAKCCSKACAAKLRGRQGARTAAKGRTASKGRAKPPRMQQWGDFDGEGGVLDEEYRRDSAYFNAFGVERD